MYFDFKNKNTSQKKNIVLNVVLTIVLIPFLWIFLILKMLKNKEEQTSKNIIISFVSWFIFIIFITIVFGSPKKSPSTTGNVNSTTIGIDTSSEDTTSETTTIQETTTPETTTIQETTTPEPATIQETTVQDAAIPETSEPLVWIDDTGKKYHSRSDCSNMSDPYQVPLSQAHASGRDACKRCD